MYLPVEKEEQDKKYMSIFFQLFPTCKTTEN